MARLQKLMPTPLSNDILIEGLSDAYKEICSAYEWPWQQNAEWNIGVPDNYATGTVNVTPGSNLVTGNGTAWDTTWKYRRILVGPDAMDYRIREFADPVTATLEQPATITTPLTSASYTIFQDTYPMPGDYEPGQDTLMMQPGNRIRVPHLPRLTLEQQYIVQKQFFSNIPQGFCDWGVDLTTLGQPTYLIRIIPPPSGATQLRMSYRRRMPDTDDPDRATGIPTTFDDVVEMTAAAKIGMKYGIAGAQAWDMMATKQKKRLMRRTANTQMANTPKSHGSGWTDSSFSEGGLSIGPWPK